MNPNLIECTVTNENNETDYPFSSALYRGGFRLTLSKNVAFIIGDNGAGKSTLLEGIAAKIGFASTGGNKNHVLQSEALGSLIDAYAGDYRDEAWERLRDGKGRPLDNLRLSDHIKLVWRVKPRDGFFFRAESFLTLVKLQQFGCDGLSHGEGIVQLISGFKGGIFILDEPESGLSPLLQLRLMYLIRRQTQAYNAQYIIATHSPILMAYPDAELFEMDESDLRSVSFRETQHYLLTRRILDNPQAFFDKFFDESEE